MLKGLNVTKAILHQIVVASKRFFLKQKSFESSEKFWMERYKNGGNSGTGSYNSLAEFKGEIINSFVKGNDIETVHEFGCGDGNQLKYFNFQSYIGYDVSPHAINRCHKLFKNDKSKNFKLIKDYKENTVDLAMSLDVIYHLTEEETYNNYMSRLFQSSHRFVIIYSSNTDENEGNGPHVKHRKFTKWIESNRPDFELLSHIHNKYPFNGDWSTTSLADFYIFKLNKKTLSTE
jgi:SAM-dependent methyltransferase